MAINQWLRPERKLPDLWQAITREMRRHFNCFGLTDNSRALWCFDHAVRQLLLNRDSFMEPTHL